MPLLLLPYATTTQALSATTAQVIHGTEPYLTFDNGVTKVTTTDSLLGITISDGTTQTTYTPSNNTSTAAHPIVLPVANQRFSDIGMLVPTNTNSIALSALIGAPYNYWGDDDGDGQGTNGITATGNLSVSITDKNGQAVSRDTVLSLCDKAPYKVVLTSTAGSLTTQYGLPNSSSFSGGTATYYISPKAVPTICYARPNLKYGTNNESNYPRANFAGSATIWNPDKGFLVQSTTPSSYSRNFPTTGANGLYFDLLVEGIDASTLTWSVVTNGSISASMSVKPPRDSCSSSNSYMPSCYNPDGASSVRVSLSGPSIDTPTLPQTFELVGKDRSNREVVSYGFELQHWFAFNNQPCSFGGYRLPQIKDLTNAKCDGSWCQSFAWPVATPTSPGDYYQRNIGAGLFTEWGSLHHFRNIYWIYRTSDSRGSDQLFVSSNNGQVYSPNGTDNNLVCVYP